MATKLAIDDDVISAARAIADRQHRTIQSVVSQLARETLRRERGAGLACSDIPQLPISNPDAVITLDLVNRMRDQAA